MAEEDKHTIHKYESLNSLVTKLDLDFTSLQERGGGVRPVLPQLRLVVGGCGGGGMPF